MIIGNKTSPYFTRGGSYGDFANVVSKGYNASVYGDVYLTGYFYILFTRIPEFMKEDVSELGDFTQMTRVLNNAVQIPGRELQYTEVTTSFGGASKVVIPTMLTNGHDLSINYNELSGLPMLRFHKRWLTGIRDATSGLSDIPNYSIKNYTADLLYITTKPVHFKQQGSYSALKGIEGNPQIVESAHYFTGVWPANNPEDLLSGNIEASDKIDVGINYKFNNMWDNQQAHDFASTKLDEMIKVKDMDAYQIDANGLVDNTVN